MRSLQTSLASEEARMRFTGPEESLLQEVVSMEEDLQRLREEAALFVQEGSPAILAV